MLYDYVMDDVTMRIDYENKCICIEQDGENRVIANFIRDSDVALFHKILDKIIEAESEDKE